MKRKMGKRKEKGFHENEVMKDITIKVIIIIKILANCNIK